MGSNMGKNLAEEDDRHVVARRIFKALCALYPDRYLMLALPGDVLVLRDVVRDPPPAAALAADPRCVSRRSLSYARIPCSVKNFPVPIGRQHHDTSSATATPSMAIFLSAAFRRWAFAIGRLRRDRHGKTDMRNV